LKRTKLRDRILPVYTKGEEIFNTVSHIVGGAVGVAVTALCVVIAAWHHNVFGIVSGAIYGATMIILYTMSSIYHALKPESMSKKVFQIIDHCTIFILIAGTYTPFTLCTFREYSSALGWTMFGIIWGAAVIGIVLNSIDLKKYKIFSMICYLGMGWCIIFRANLLPTLLGTAGVVLLVTGGVAYTVGALLYVLGKKLNIKYMHSVFHLFVVAGSILQFLCIILYVM